MCICSFIAWPDCLKVMEIFISNVWGSSSLASSSTQDLLLFITFANIMGKKKVFISFFKFEFPQLLVRTSIFSCAYLSSIYAYHQVPYLCSCLIFLWLVFFSFLLNTEEASSCILTLCIGQGFQLITVETGWFRQSGICERILSSSQNQWKVMNNRLEA